MTEEQFTLEIEAFVEKARAFSEGWKGHFMRAVAKGIMPLVDVEEDALVVAGTDGHGNDCAVIPLADLLTELGDRISVSDDGDDWLIPADYRDAIVDAWGVMNDLKRAVAPA